jgi:hypothetical protein
MKRQPALQSRSTEKLHSQLPAAQLNSTFEALPPSMASQEIFDVPVEAAELSPWLIDFEDGSESIHEIVREDGDLT